jgi:Arrestin (or S-antigen), C-terminal domain/Arrestin (or S-antigen), N-terminal domain
MAPASVQVACMEPVVYLRGQSAVGEDARGRRRQIDFDAPPSQLRGLVTLYLPRPSRIKEITITLQGKSRTDWPEGIGPNRLDTVEESIIFSQKVILFTSRDTQSPSRTRRRASSVGPGINWTKDEIERRAKDNSITGPASTTPSPLVSPALIPSPPLTNEDPSNGGKEFPKGTFNYPFSIPLPSNLPPTLHADFGSNAYSIRAHVHRAGPLTSNLSSEMEVTLVHAPDENGSEEVESIVVERNWEDALRYMIVVMGKSFPVGGKIPIWAKFVPMEKVRIHRIFATLEERTAYYAKGRRVARHEVPRRWTLLKILPVSDTPSFKSSSSNNKGILPILSENTNAIMDSPLANMTRAAAAAYSGAVGAEEKEEAMSFALASLADPSGPWEFAMELEVPTGTSTRINISSNHLKSNIAVHHIVRLSIRVERLDAYGSVSADSIPESQKKLYDILIEAPVAINHSHTANAWLTLPDYWSVPPPPPNDVDEEQNGNSSNARSSTVSNTTQSRPNSSNGKKSEARLEIERRILRNALQSVRNTSSAAAALTSTQDTNGMKQSPLQKQKNKQKQQQSPSPAQRDTNGQRLARLSRQWLSLTASGSNNTLASNTNGGSPQGSPTGFSHFASRSSSVPPRSAQMTVTYGGPYFGDVETHLDAEDTGLPPTYAMIDGARGSIDLPPSQRSRPDGK